MRRTTAASLHVFTATALIAAGCSGSQPDSNDTLDGGAPPALSTVDASAAHATRDASMGVLLAPFEPGDPDAGAAAPDAASAPDASLVNSCGYTNCVPGQPCADLIIDSNEMSQSILISTQTFDPTSCEIVEGCITTPGTRRLLRFDMATVNVGTADLVLGQPTTEACFQFSQCHGHYHFQGFARYTLYRSDGTTVAAVGHKQAFCLEDVEPSPMINPTPAMPAQLFDCTHQGIHIGYEDVYPNDVPCQWVDITDVPPGDYVLSAVVNAAGNVPELNLMNNEARVPVTIPPN